MYKNIILLLHLSIPKLTKMEPFKVIRGKQDTFGSITQCPIHSFDIQVADASFCKCNTTRSIFSFSSKKQLGSSCNSENAIKTYLNCASFQSITTEDYVKVECEYKRWSLEFLSILNYIRTDSKSEWQSYSSKSLFDLLFKYRENKIMLQNRHGWNGLLVQFEYKCKNYYICIVVKFYGERVSNGYKEQSSDLVHLDPLPNDLQNITNTFIEKINPTFILKINSTSKTPYKGSTKLFTKQKTSPQDYQHTNNKIFKKTNTKERPDDDSGSKGIIGVTIATFLLIFLIFMVFFISKKRKNARRTEKYNSEMLKSLHHSLDGTNLTPKKENHLVELMGSQIKSSQSQKNAM